MAREIYTNPQMMAKIQIISDSEENSYSDIPGWKGGYMAEARSGLAVLLYFPDRPGKDAEVWFPYSQLRKAEDDQSIYASNWILEQKKL